MSVNAAAKSASITVPEEVKAVVAACPAPMAVVDERGRFFAANPAFCAAAGWEKLPAEGASVDLPTSANLSPLRLPGASGLLLATLPAAELSHRLLNALPIMASAKDAEGRYLFMNAYQAAHYGVAVERVIGRRLRELAGERYGDHLAEMDEQIVRTGCPVGFFETEGAGVDGELRNWLSFKGPLRGADGEVEGVAFMAVDLTERKGLEEALQMAKARAEEAVRTRGRYLATMGHELKTPLHSIVGFSEFLAQETLGPLGCPTYRDYAQDIAAAGRHLLDMVNDILDMARLEAGRLPLEEEPVDLARTAADVARMLALPARHKDIDVSVTVAERMPQIIADVRRIRQIMVNLLSNAVKFTPHGGKIVITVGQAENSDILIEVRDDGVGIRAEDIPVVMTPFGRVRAAGAPVQDGAGLGLPLVKALSEAHGGRFELVSEPGEGACARVLLPRYRLRP